jgi:hypothetical protein
MVSNQLRAILTELQMSIDSTFIPWSLSRNAKENHRSLNWRVDVLKSGKKILTVDYSAGTAFCPGYVVGASRRERQSIIDYETEHGISTVDSTKIKPCIFDVIYSLVSELDTLDFASFEEWAENYGYDPDSRRAEAIYKTCLDNSLRLRAALGDHNLNRLRDAAFGC